MRATTDRPSGDEPGGRAAGLSVVQEYEMTNDVAEQEYWLRVAGDALGRYLAEGGEVEVMTAEDDGRLVTLVSLPGDAVLTVEPAIARPADAQSGCCRLPGRRAAGNDGPTFGR